MLVPPLTGRFKNKRTIALVGTIIAVLLAGSIYFVSNSYPPCPSNSVEGFALYVKIVADNTGSPISGAQISGQYHDVRECTQSSSFGGTTTLITHTYVGTTQLPALVTPENGTITIVPAYVGNYTIVVQYGGRTYSVPGNVHPIWATSLTVSLPSGRFNQTYIQE
jgi:hypothetical protein